MKAYCFIMMSWFLMTSSGLFAQYPNVRLTFNSDDQHETAIAINSVNPTCSFDVWPDLRTLA